MSSANRSQGCWAGTYGVGGKLRCETHSLPPRSIAPVNGVKHQRYCVRTRVSVLSASLTV